MVQLTEDEIDDLVYFARAGDAAELTATLAAAVSSRAKDGEGGGKSATALVLLAAAVDEGANTPLHMAAGNGHEDIVRFVLDQIRDGDRSTRQKFIDAANGFGNTALHWAAMNGHLGVVRLLVEDGGASPALANDKNYVPLDLAGLNDKTAVVDYFLASTPKDGKETPKASASEVAEGLSVATGSLDIAEEDDGEEEEVVVLRAGDV